MNKNFYSNSRELLKSKELFELAKESAYEYIDTLEDRPVFPSLEDLEKLKHFEEELPLQGTSGSEILTMLHQYGSPNTCAVTGGRYYGFVLGGALPLTQAVRWLADVWNQNAAVGLMSPVASKIESIAEKWLVELFGLPKNTAVGFVTGSSSANLCALAAARNSLLKRIGFHLKEEGIYNSPKIKVVMSDQAHATVFKALYLLGFGDKDITLVKSDKEGRIIVSEMPQLDNQTIVVLQASNLSTGSYEDFDSICTLANKAGAWVHVDGAFGLWAAVSKKLNYLTKEYEKADSWAADCHKTLNTTYDGAMVFVKNEEDLTSTMQASGDYLDFSGGRNGMVYTLDMSRRARFEIWAALKYLGREGTAQLIENLVQNAKIFEKQLKEAGFEILNEVVFNQVLFCCENEETTNDVLKKVQQSGVCWCGGTKWKGKSAIRISVSSWATNEEDVKKSVEIFQKVLENK